MRPYAMLCYQAHSPGAHAARMFAAETQRLKAECARAAPAAGAQPHYGDGAAPRRTPSREALDSYNLGSNVAEAVMQWATGLRTQPKN
jgi:hypothetical protein